MQQSSIINIIFSTLKNWIYSLKDLPMNLQLTFPSIRRKMSFCSQGANSILIALFCVALITYTLFLKATNHLARERAIKSHREMEIFPKFLTPDGAWCWFADPRAVHYEGPVHKRTFVGWVNSLGDIMVGGFDHVTLNTLPEVTIKAKLQKDDHANPSLLVLDSGHVVIFYSAHNGNTMFFKISKLPEDISAWGKEHFVNTNTEGNKGYTYPSPFLFNQEGESSKLVLLWRGGTWKPTFSQVKDLNTWEWKPSQALISGQGARPYIKYTSSYNKDNKFPRIHMAFTDGHPRNELTNSIYYAYLENNHLYRADGSSISSIDDLPISPSRAQLVYNAKHVGGGKSWIWDIAIDQSGHPVLVYVRFPSDHDHEYFYARWTGSEWLDRKLVGSGKWFPETPKGKIEPEPNYSGGISLDHSDPSRLVLSRMIEGVFEIELWSTPDGGLTWTRKKVTSKSSRNNVRPYIPLGYNSAQGTTMVLWMTGIYEHFTKYKTAIKFAFV